MLALFSAALITGVTAVGNGCPPNSYDYSMSNDGRYLTIRYYDFAVAAADGNFDVKNCQLSFEAQPPRGYKVGVDATAVSGYLLLSDFDAHATVTTRYITDMGRYPVDIMQMTYSGPADRQVTASGFVSRNNIQYTNCDDRQLKTVDFETELAIDTRGFGRGDFGGARATDPIVQEFRIVTERCDSTPPPSGDWRGECRVVHEWVWGDDIQDYWGYGRAASRSAATQRAREDGNMQCENARNGNNLSRCVVVESSCDAVRS